MHLKIEIDLPETITNSNEDQRTEMLYILSKIREKLVVNWKQGPIYTSGGEFVGTFVVTEG
jgi:hypothetical protein